MITICISEPQCFQNECFVDLDPVVQLGFLRVLCSITLSGTYFGFESLSLSAGIGSEPLQSPTG